MKAKGHIQMQGPPALRPAPHPDPLLGGEGEHKPEEHA
jgi:hypothetical protein